MVNDYITTIEELERENEIIRSTSLKNIFVSNAIFPILEEIYLSENEEINLTKLSKLVNGNYSRTVKHVNDLCNLLILKEIKFGRIRIIRFNNTNIAWKIKMMLAKWHGVKK
jgi:hypothetical protein